MYADMIVNGMIYTGEGACVQAMAVKDGRIIATGAVQEIEKLRGADTSYVKVQEGMVLPGMTEGHAHVTSTYEILNYAPLYEGNSIEEYQSILKNFLKSHPDIEVLMGRGYKNGVFGEPGPRAAMLDEVSCEIPIVAIGEDAHSVWVNTKALHIAGVDRNTPDIPNGEIVRDDKHNPTGWLKEAADVLILPCLLPLEKEKVKEAILHYQQMALSHGITHVFEPMLNLQRDYDVCIRAYEELAQENKLCIRFQIGYMLYPSSDLEELQREMDKACEYRRRAEAIGNEYYEMDTIKLFVDGVLEGRTAFLLEEYEDQHGGCGEALWTQSALDEVVCMAAKHKFQVHIHTIGDGALDMAIHAFAKARKRGIFVDRPHAVTHVQIVHKNHFKQLADLGVAVVVNPYWHTRDELYFEEIEKPYLGEKRAEQEYPVRSFLDAGCVVSQASDFPVTIPADPMTGLHILVNRGEHKYGEFEPLNPAETLSVEQALRVLTVNGARQGGIESHTGSLTVGKDADFVILDKNLLTIPEAELYTAKVNAVYLRGVCKYKRSLEKEDI